MDRALGELVASDLLQSPQTPPGPENGGPGPEETAALEDADDVDPFKCVPCGGYGAIEIKNEQETAKLKAASCPVRPSEAEVEDHRLTHLPYRNWCPECVAGRGLGEQRGRHVGRDHEIPRVGIDYWFITTGGLKTMKE